MIFKLICKPGETEQEARERFAEVYFNDDIGFLGIFIKLMEAQTQAGKRCSECFAANKPAAVFFYRLNNDSYGKSQYNQGYNPIFSLALCPEHDRDETCMLLCNEFGAFYAMVKHVKKTMPLEREPDDIEPLFIITINSDDYKHYERCFVGLIHRIECELVDYFEQLGFDRGDAVIGINECSNFRVEEYHTEAEVKALIERTEAEVKALIEDTNDEEKGE